MFILLLHTNIGSYKETNSSVYVSAFKIHSHIFVSLIPLPRRSSPFPVVILVVHMAQGGQYPSLIKFKQQQLLDVGLEVAVHCPPSLSALGTWPVPGDAAHLWGRGRLDHHPIRNPGTPNHGFQLYSGGYGPFRTASFQKHGFDGAVISHLRQPFWECRQSLAVWQMYRVAEVPVEAQYGELDNHNAHNTSTF